MDARSSRTVNPLHFEDLEPHRFEDLVRQLAYKYRPWRYLDATGRLGRDGGLDIRGVEVVSGGPEGSPAEPEEELDEQSEELPTGDEREWRIQCKRYKQIGAKQVREIVTEVVPDAQHAPYGLVIAAACDFSAQTMAAFREEALGRGVVETHLWPKAHLEDLLFLPENDHLLFAYFGISLGIQRRSELQRIRGVIALKRKLVRAFQGHSVSDVMLTDVLVRDIADHDYPDVERVPGFFEMQHAPWHVCRAEGLAVSGLIMCRQGWDGWVREDGSWDILEASARNPAAMGWAFRQERQRAQGAAEDAEDHSRTWDIYQRVPKSEQAYVKELWLLPYAQILEVDPLGDPAYPGPHLYCRFTGDHGPYLPRTWLIASRYPLGDLELEKENRKPLYDSLGDTPPAEQAPKDLLEDTSR